MPGERAGSPRMIGKVVLWFSCLVLGGLEEL